MTKTLTEQWKNGELPNGNYYTICSGWSMQTFPCIAYCERNRFDASVIEVLAPVPSYEKVKEMIQKIERLEFDNEALEMAHNEGKEINAEIEQYNKDLLQDHTRLVMGCDGLLAEKKQLEKKLEIATKALKKISRCYSPEYNKAGEISHSALKEMEGVK